MIAINQSTGDEGVLPPCIPRSVMDAMESLAKKMQNAAREIAGLVKAMDDAEYAEQKARESEFLVMCKQGWVRQLPPITREVIRAAAIPVAYQRRFARHDRRVPA